MLAKMLDLIMRLAARPPATVTWPRRRLGTTSRRDGRDSRDAGRRVTSVRSGGRA